jgi:hypothetical protein
MLQRGQLFEVQSTSPDDKTLWAFRYRVGGCDSRRVQRVGCDRAGRGEAFEARTREASPRQGSGKTAHAR